MELSNCYYDSRRVLNCHSIVLKPICEQTKVWYGLVFGKVRQGRCNNSSNCICGSKRYGIWDWNKCSSYRKSVEKPRIDSFPSFTVIILFDINFFFLFLLTNILFFLESVILISTTVEMSLLIWLFTYDFILFFAFCFCNKHEIIIKNIKYFQFHYFLIRKFFFL